MTTNTGDHPNPAPARTGAEPAPGSATTPTRMRDLHPGWFASVMGTAIVAVATYDNPGNVTSLSGVAHGMGTGLAVLAYALGAVLAVAYAVRWVRHTDACRADLRHPVLGAMHATLPGGLLVLAVMTSVIGSELFPASAVTALIATLAAVGAALGLVLSVAFAYTLFTGETAAASVNGGWFIPPVVTIIIPVALAPLIPHASAGTARLLLALGYATYGMGFLLFLLTMGLLHDHLVLHPMPPAALAPTVWIALGPVGVGALAPLAGFAHRHDRLGALRHRRVGLRALVARDRRRPPRPVPAGRPPAVPPGLVGLHLPPRCLHRGHPHPRPGLAGACPRDCRRAPLPHPGRLLGHRDRQDRGRDRYRPYLATLTPRSGDVLMGRREWSSTA
jgi:tellurite resistance protein TehA-like permease